jgi:hypothetical protein
MSNSTSSRRTVNLRFIILGVIFIIITTLLGVVSSVQLLSFVGFSAKQIRDDALINFLFFYRLGATSWFVSSWVIPKAPQEFTKGERKVSVKTLSLIFLLGLFADVGYIGALSEFLPTDLEPNHNFLKLASKSDWKQITVIVPFLCPNCYDSHRITLRARPLSLPMANSLYRLPRTSILILSNRRL